MGRLDRGEERIERDRQIEPELIRVRESLTSTLSIADCVAFLKRKGQLSK